MPKPRLAAGSSSSSTRMMTLSPGEMFYENPDDIHMVSANASDSEPARILVHIIKTIGVPVSTPVSGGKAPGAPPPE